MTGAPDGLTFEWRAAVTDAELVDLVDSHGGAGAPGWWDRIRPHSLGWVTARTSDGLLVGFANVAWDGGDHAFLLDPKTRGDHQHQGIGTAVVGHAVEGARAAGCEWLHVDFDDDLGAFYFEACGFRPTTAGLVHLTELPAPSAEAGAAVTAGTVVVSLDEFYDDYPRIEDEINAFVGESLGPRGPDTVYDVVAHLGLPAGAAVVDVGCGEGGNAVELVRRFGFSVTGVDPLARHLELATAAAVEAGVSDATRFVPGSAEAIPVGDRSIDLVWCREVLYHVPDLVSAFREMQRVLRRDRGRVVLSQLYATDLLEPREAAALWGLTGVDPRSADLAHVESAMAAGGLRIVERIDLHSETGEWAQEQDGKAGRELLAVARLRRDPQRYVDRFGRAAYETKLGDALWHVNRMMGKLSSRIHVLEAAPD